MENNDEMAGYDLDETGTEEGGTHQYTSFRIHRLGDAGKPSGSARDRMPGLTEEDLTLTNVVLPVPPSPT